MMVLVKPFILDCCFLCLVVKKIFAQQPQPPSRSQQLDPQL